MFNKTQRLCCSDRCSCWSFYRKSDLEEISVVTPRRLLAGLKPTWNKSLKLAVGLDTRLAIPYDSHLWRRLAVRLAVSELMF